MPWGSFLNAGFFGKAKATLKSIGKKMQPEKKKQDTDFGDDYGAYCRGLLGKCDRKFWVSTSAFDCCECLCLFRYRDPSFIAFTHSGMIHAELDLSCNVIERLAPDFGNISTLTKLNLSRNRLEKVPRSMNTFEHLVDLNLSENILSEAPTEIAKLRSLEKLDLSRQGKGDLLELLPKEFQGLELLKELRLSGNNFKYLPDCIFPEMDGSVIVKPGMTNLRVLAINDNPLLGLDEV